MNRVLATCVIVSLSSCPSFAASPKIDGAIKTFKSVAADAGKLKVYCEMKKTMDAAGSRHQADEDEEKKVHGSSRVSPTMTSELMLGIARARSTGRHRGWLPDYEQLDQHRRAYRHGELDPLPHGDASPVRISLAQAKVRPTHRLVDLGLTERTGRRYPRWGATTRVRPRSNRRFAEGLARLPGVLRGGGSCNRLVSGRHWGIWREKVDYDPPP